MLPCRKSYFSPPALGVLLRIWLWQSSLSRSAVSFTVVFIWLFTPFLQYHINKLSIMSSENHLNNSDKEVDEVDAALSDLEITLEGGKTSTILVRAGSGSFNLDLKSTSLPKHWGWQSGRKHAIEWIDLNEHFESSSICKWETDFLQWRNRLKTMRFYNCNSEMGTCVPPNIAASSLTSGGPQAPYPCCNVTDHLQWMGWLSTESRPAAPSTSKLSEWNRKRDPWIPLQESPLKLSSFSCRPVVVMQ